MRNKQMAVDFLLKEMSDIIGIVNTDAFQNLLMVDAYNKAKKMEKEQIMNAFDKGYSYDLFNGGGEQYYNETYKQQDNEQ